MKTRAIGVLMTLAAAAAAQARTSARPAGSATRICADQAHGQGPLVDPYAALAAKLNAEIVTASVPITAETLKGCRLLIVRVPTQEIKSEESAAIAAFVRGGGALLLAFDEERRAPLAATRVNDVIAPFGMKLSADTEYLHNNGAIVKKGAISAADRELPFSGGRAVEGGTPFGWQLDKDGKPGDVFAASATSGNGGRSSCSAMPW